jgi:hypothetical protein
MAAAGNAGKGPVLPPPPKVGGGHYVMVGGKPQLIKAVGPGKWAPASSIKAGKGNPNAGFNSALYNPSQILSGKALDTAAGNIADAQTKGPISELASQMATDKTSNQAGQQQDFGYYMQLAKAAQDAVGQQQQQGAALNTTLQGVNGQQQAAIAQFGQQAQGGALGRMGALGLDGGQVAAMGATTAQQQGIGALNAQTFQSAGANQAANYTADATANRGVVSLEGEQQIGDLARAGALANEPLTAKIGALQASRGALKATALGSLRQAERSYQIAEQGLQNTANAQGITAANDVARNKLTASGQAVTMRGQSITQQNDLAKQLQASADLSEKTSNDALTQAYRRAAAIAKGGGKGVLTQAQQNAMYSAIDQARTLIGTASAAGHTAAAIKQSLQTGTLIKGLPHMDPALIEAAYELKGWGYILPKTAQQLHMIGLRGGRYQVKNAPALTPVNAAVKGALGSIGIG